MEIKAGDRVLIAETSEFYSEMTDVNPRVEGTVIEYDGRGRESYAYHVKWDNGHKNGYRIYDLKLVDPDRIKESYEIF